MVFLTWCPDGSAVKTALLWDKKIFHTKNTLIEKKSSHNNCSFFQANVNQRHASSKIENSKIA